MDSLNSVVPNAAKNLKYKLWHYRYKFANKPIAILPNAISDRASANNDCHLKPETVLLWNKL